MELDLSAVQQQRLKDYYPDIQNIAKRFFHADGVLHSTANTTQDYAQDLLTKAWVAQGKLADKGVYDPKSEKRWVLKSVWNEARSAYWSKRSADNKVYESVVEIDPVDWTANPESILSVRETSDQLHQSLSPNELDLLSRLGENRNNLSVTLATYGNPVRLKCFSKIVKRVRARAKEIIDNGTILGKFSGVDQLYIIEESDMNKPECFGIAWEPFGDSVCVGCGGKRECLDEFAKTTYAEKLQELKSSGQDASVANLAAALELGDQSIIETQQYLERLPLATIPESDRDGDLEKSNPPPMEPDVSNEETESLATVTQLPVAPPPEPVEIDPERLPHPLQKVVEAVEPPKEKKPPKKKRGRPKKSEAKEVPSVPQKAGAAESVEQPAAVRKTVKKSAKSAKGQGATSQKKRKKRRRKKAARVWGTHTYRARWQREREKHPMIALLTPGVRISKVYKGETFKVTVRNGYYLFNGEKYPTLQSVTTAATGVKDYPKQAYKGQEMKGTRKTGNWSAMRFWKIKELMNQSKSTS